MPSSSSVRITRMAISPRFATRTLPNMGREGYVLNPTAAAPMTLGMGLLGRFSVLSLVATVLLGMVVGATLRSQIKHRAIENAGQSASLVARFGIQPQLTKSDLTDGLNKQEIAALDGILRAGYTTGSVKTIKIWNASGTVIYSNRHELIGDRDNKDEGFRVALGGKVDAEATGAEEDSSHAQADGRLLESYVPLSLASNGYVDGVFELYMDYQPVADSIRHDERRVFLVLAVSLLALYA